MPQPLLTEAHWVWCDDGE